MYYLFAVNTMQYPRVYLFDLVIYISQVAEGNRLYSDLIWWLSVSSGSMVFFLSPDSKSLCVAEQLLTEQLLIWFL